LPAVWAVRLIVRFVGGISCEDTAANVHKLRAVGRGRRECLSVVALRGHRRDRATKRRGVFYALGGLASPRRGVSCEDTCAARPVRRGVGIWGGMFCCRLDLRRGAVGASWLARDGCASGAPGRRGALARRGLAAGAWSARRVCCPTRFVDIVAGLVSAVRRRRRGVGEAAAQIAAGVPTPE